MHPGDIVAGKYRVTRILARSRGLLLEARHTEFDQKVVIRLLSPAMCDDKELERFRREARTLSKLESEHCARIIDVGTHSDGSFFLVRQYLEGTDLATHLRNQGALRLDEAVLYLLQAAEVVQECHSHKIILRELAPSHLFLSQKRGGTPSLKVIDFGTAKVMKDPAGDIVNGEMTATVMFGMSNYSSPELVRKAGLIDHRTDVWSLGCIFYEMLAAVPPFTGELAELMLKITRDDAIPLSRMRPDLPRELDQIMGWALAKDMNSRFSSVYALAHALRPYASAEGQVLIDRIGRIAHAAPDAAEEAAISPTSPLAKGASALLDDDDDGSTVIMQSDAEPDFEKTSFMADSPFARSSHVPPARSSVAPPRASSPENGTTGGVVSPTGTGGFPAQGGAGQKVRQRKVAVAAIGAALVLVPALVVVLVLALNNGPETSAVAENKNKGSGNKKSGDPGATDGDGSGEESSSGNSESTSGDGPFEQIDPGGGGPRVPGGPTTTTKTSETAPAASSTPTTPTPPPPPTTPVTPPTGGGTGKLVAVAVGGSCAFTVDGASQGTKSSITLTVPVGPHTVSCAPPGKATRTQKVTVTADKPGMAMFKLGG